MKGNSVSQIHLTGGKCGGTYIDRNLHELLTKRFGKAFTDLAPEMIGAGSRFMSYFEGHKKDFSRARRSNRRPIRIPLNMPNVDRAQKGYDRRTGDVLLSFGDMKGLFEPVVKNILKLVGDQVDQVKKNKEPVIETLVLVGGLGSSPYLRENLQDWCLERDIRLTTPVSGAYVFIDWKPN
jgi:hypothetical protein